MEFPEGWGGLRKNFLPWGRYGYFLELHKLNLVHVHRTFGISQLRRKEIVSTAFILIVFFCILSLFSLFHNVDVPRSECCFDSQFGFSGWQCPLTPGFSYLTEKHTEMEKWLDGWLSSTST